MKDIAEKYLRQLRWNMHWLIDIANFMLLRVNTVSCGQIVNNNLIHTFGLENLSK